MASCACLLPKISNILLLINKLGQDAFKLATLNSLGEGTEEHLQVPLERDGKEELPLSLICGASRGNKAARETTRTRPKEPKGQTNTLAMSRLKAVNPGCLLAF